MVWIGMSVCTLLLCLLSINWYLERKERQWLKFLDKRYRRKKR